jgi:hypothetical protein
MDVGSRWIVLLHFPHSPHPCGLAMQEQFAEKVGMRALKSSIYTPHPSPLPEGEGIVRNSLKHSLNKLIPFMARRPTEVPMVQAHHERNQHLVVRPELVEGLCRDSLSRYAMR